MITTKIQIKPHLAEYAKQKYSIPGKEYILLSDTEYLYHVLCNLMSKRPENAHIDTSNLEIALPHQSRGKAPETYNYITASGAKNIEKKLNRLFWAEMHEFVDEHVNTHGEPINETVFLFKNKYGIESITEDALIKSYYRWRSKIRTKIKKRKYTKS
jgi:hypothetical protein